MALIFSDISEIKLTSVFILRFCNIQTERITHPKRAATFSVSRQRQLWTSALPMSDTLFAWGRHSWTGQISDLWETWLMETLQIFFFSLHLGKSACKIIQQLERTDKCTGGRISRLSFTEQPNVKDNLYYHRTSVTSHEEEENNSKQKEAEGKFCCRGSVCVVNGELLHSLEWFCSRRNKSVINRPRWTMPKKTTEYIRGA